MKVKEFRYSQLEVQRMKELIRTGKPILQIAQEEYKNFGARKNGFLQKLYKVSKSTRKIRKWEGPQKVRNTQPKPIEKGEVINVPKGVSLDLTAKKVMMYNDHVRIYF